MKKKRLIIIIVCIIALISLLAIVSDWENFKAGLFSKPSIENTERP